MRERLPMALWTMRPADGIGELPVCLTLGVCCATTLAMFVFQGFHTAGFNLDKSLMHWMGCATIGSIGGLAAIVYKRLIRQSP